MFSAWGSGGGEPEWLILFCSALNIFHILSLKCFPVIRRKEQEFLHFKTWCPCASLSPDKCRCCSCLRGGELLRGRRPVPSPGVDFQQTLAADRYCGPKPDWAPLQCSVIWVITMTNIFITLNPLTAALLRVVWKANWYRLTNSDNGSDNYPSLELPRLVEQKHGQACSKDCCAQIPQTSLCFKSRFPHLQDGRGKWLPPLGL